MATDPLPAGDPPPPEPSPDHTRGPDAVRQSVRLLVPVALDLLHQEFGLRRPPGEASLWSALTSFERHFLDGQFEDARTQEDLAAHLVRIALNRRERLRRREERMQSQLRRPRDADSAAAPFDPPDDAPGPEQEAGRKDEDAKMRWLVAQVLKELKADSQSKYEARVLQVYLGDLEQQQGEIARAVGCSQSAVSRIIERFHDRVRDLLRQSTEA